MTSKISAKFQRGANRGGVGYNRRFSTNISLSFRALIDNDFASDVTTLWRYTNIFIIYHYYKEDY